MSVKIIKRDNAALLRCSEATLQSARDTASDMLRQASIQAATLLEAAQAQGREDAENEKARLIVQAIAYRESWFTGLESELASVVASAVRTIFAEYEEDQRLAIAVSRALAEMQRQKGVVMRVHPSRHRCVRDTVDRLFSARQWGAALTVEADTSLEPSACVLVSPVGVIETSLESQIQAIEDGLRPSLVSQ